MSWLSGLFGGKKKADYGAIYPEPPKLEQVDYGLWLNQIDDLINNWDDIKTGKSQFDAVKFLYEPQKAEMEQLYGINAPGYTGQASTGDLFARGGSIPRTMASMNKSGTLDTGTAGLVQGQMEGQMNKDLAGLFGQAKQTQRNDYINSLAQLQRLYPERYQVANIPTNLKYFNDMNSYNVALQRNAATEADRLQRLASTNSFMGNLFGLGANAILPGSGQIVSGMANAGMSNFGGQTGVGTSTGGSNWSSFLSNLFGNNSASPTTRNQTTQTMSPFSGYNTASLNYSNTGSDMFNPYGNTASNVPNQFGASTNPVNKTSGGMDFSKLLQAMMSGGAGAGSMFA